MATNNNKHWLEESGGFDYKLVEPPPEQLLQIECPVCLLIIRDPYQVKCCGYSYCHTCIERIKASKNPCPTCKSKIEDFPDKGLQKKIYSLRIYCTLKEVGCEWTGELRQRDTHLNEDPELEKQLDRCQFVEIDCLYECGDRLQRRYMQKHQTELCTKRPFSCEHCHNYESNYDDVLHNHWPVCGSFPLPCPNQCGSFPQRQNIENHIDNECPLTTINCDFHHVGCAVKLPRKDMPEHLRENLLTHTSLLSKSYVKILKENMEYKTKIKALETENKHLMAINESTILRIQNEKLKPTKCKISDLENSFSQLQRELQTELSKNIIPSTTVPLSPPTLTMSNFKKLKAEGTPWYSPPVYTHHQGYKIGLAVVANGWDDGEGYYISVFVHLRRGEFDDNLDWPFYGEISFQILDQINGNKHTSHTVYFNDEVDQEACSRVTVGEYGRNSGSSTFLPQNQHTYKMTLFCFKSI